MQSGQGGTRRWVLEFEPGSPKRADPLMGWIGSADTRGQVRLRFATKDAAIAFAERNGITYQVVEPHARQVQLKSYTANFIRRPE
jgi:hypothetical protein